MKDSGSVQVSGPVLSGPAADLLHRREKVAASIVQQAFRARQTLLLGLAG